MFFALLFEDKSVISLYNDTTPHQADPFVRGTLFLLVILFGCNSNETYSVATETVEVDSLSQVLLLTGPQVKPKLYTHVRGLASLPVAQAKETFISAVLPAILVAKHEIETMRTKMSQLKEKRKWEEADSAAYLEEQEKFKSKNLDDLIFRMGTLPNSIVLAQAAVESGWGKSRFFLEGNNLFGVWSYNSDEPRIAAGLNRMGKTIYIRSYENISESILHYFEVLGSAHAYRGLRKARQEETDPFLLLPHLKHYSERRTTYTNQLKAMILQNDLMMYDKFEIDPQYLVRD